MLCMASCCRPDAATAFGGTATLRRVIAYHILPNVPVLDAFWTTPFLLPGAVLSTLKVTIFSCNRSLMYDTIFYRVLTDSCTFSAGITENAAASERPCRPDMMRHAAQG